MVSLICGIKNKQTNQTHRKKRSDLWPPEATVGAGAEQIGEIGQK